MRRRLDAELVRRGLAASIEEATAALADGSVVMPGRPAVKPETLVGADEPIARAGPPRTFVSRGGDKLDAAIHRFAVPVAGRNALDAGASTGGFTDCLLSHRAAHVLAVDVGYGQLDWRLRQDPRVSVMDRTNVRDLRPDGLPFAPSVITADLAFISLTQAIPTLGGCAAPEADMVLLVKPQFEAPRRAVGRGGVVVDPAVWGEAIRSVATACARVGFPALGVMVSPLLGPAGNAEFLLHARDARAGSFQPPERLAAQVDEALRGAAMLREARLAAVGTGGSDG